MTIPLPHSEHSHEREFHSAMVAAYKRAKDLQRRVLYLSYASTLLAALSALDLSGWEARCLLLGIVALQIWSRLLAHTGRQSYTYGESLRREHRRLDALGLQPPPRAVHDLPTPSEGLTLGEVDGDRVYYDSNAPAGRARLIESLAQSALQTELIAQQGARENAIIFFAAWLVATVAIVILAGIPSESIAFQTHHAVLALFAGLMLSPHFDAWRAYADLRVTARECANNFINLLGSPSPTAGDELERWKANYDCALAAAPVFPDRLWKKTESRANEKWLRVRSPPQTQEEQPASKEENEEPVSAQ